MSSIISGNLTDKTKEDSNRRGWFLGHFMAPNSKFKNDNFEVKWGIHPKGDRKKTSAKNSTAKTIAILIKGKFVIRFSDDKEVLLSKIGDFVYWDGKIYHTYEALTNSIVLTIRWPSIPDN